MVHSRAGYERQVTCLGSLWLGDGTAGGRINWWLHTLALLTFPPLILHTKHLPWR
jgi:hypothetical protein